jgi:hypothetical protein
MRTGIVLALGAFIAAAAVISGSNGVTLRASEDEAFKSVRAVLGASLDRAGVRLNELSAWVREQSTDPRVCAEIDALVERQRSIVHALDSLAGESDDAWRGAVAGLRASVTDLEARIDRAEMMSLDSIAMVDALLRAWLDDAAYSLDVLDQLAGSSDSFVGHIDEIRSLRESRIAIADRLADFTEVDDDHGLRQSLGDKLVALRRRLHSLERAAGSGTGPRFP